MRNFILGKTLAANNTIIDNLAAGAVGFAYLNPDPQSAGKLTITTDAQKIIDNNGRGYFVLGRSNALGGPVVLPVFGNHFSYSIGKFQAATTFGGSITVPEDIVPGEDYTVIVAKKGVKFNERNKWTATLRAKDSDTASTIATKLAALINGNSESSGVTATANAAAITITSSAAGVDYNIVGADALSEAEVSITTKGSAAYGDASYVKDLANKAAADAGFEYTYMGDVNYLYPDYPLNPLKVDDSADTGFNILTIRFAEPREVKTVDDVIHQIIQVAVPSGVSFDSLETILSELAAF